jgi:hypothetical protein
MAITYPYPAVLRVATCQTRTRSRPNVKAGAVLLLTCAIVGAAPAARWYPIPVRIGKALIRTGLTLELPFNEIRKPVSDIEASDGAAARTVKEMYAAISVEDPERLKRVVRLPSGFRDFRDYVGAFHSSLRDFQKPVLDGVIPRPGGVELAVLHGTGPQGTTLRVHRLQRNGQGYEVVQSVSPSLGDMLLAETLQAAVASPDRFGQIPRPGDGDAHEFSIRETPDDPNLALKILFTGRPVHIPLMDPKMTVTDPALRFYIQSYRALGEGRINDYVNNLVASSRSKAPAGADLEELQRAIAGRTVVYLIDSAEYLLVFFKDSDEEKTAPMVLRHEGIVKSAGGRYSLNPEGNVDSIDQVLGDRDFQLKVFQRLVAPAKH